MKREEQHKREIGRKKELKNAGRKGRAKALSACQVSLIPRADSPDKRNPDAPLTAQAKAGDGGIASKRWLLLTMSPDLSLLVRQQNNTQSRTSGTCHQICRTLLTCLRTVGKTSGWVCVTLAHKRVHKQ